MNILVTGTGGFVGKNLKEMLLANKYDVLTPSRAELNLADAGQVDNYFRNNDIDVIVHAATTSRNGTSYPPDTCENNLRMFFNLQKNLSPAMKLINMGSGSEYDRRGWQKKMPEDFFGRSIPQDAHSYAKYLISKYITDTAAKNIINLRIFGIFGKYEDYRFKFISNAIVKNLAKMPILINQNVIYDYIYITDFFKIVEYFIKHDPKVRTFNVTPTESVDLITISNIINGIGDYKSDVKILNEGVGVEYSGDNRALLAEMGPFEFLPYRAAVAHLYAYYAKIIGSLDIAAIKADDYLSYAKMLQNNYFSKERQPPGK